VQNPGMCFRLACSVALFWQASLAFGLDTGLPVSVNGFGTFAGVHNDNDDVSFYDANEHTDWDTDSILGLQVKASLLDQLDVTGQLVARGYENYDLKVDWLFLTYRMQDNLAGRAGRLRIPFFMFSDSLEVGYSYPWIRPPVDVYGQLGFTTFEGADVLYSLDVAGLQLELQPFAGSTSPDLIRPGQNGQLDVTNLWGLHAVLGNDHVSLHASHSEGDFDIRGIDAIDFFLLGLQSAGYPSVADQFGTNNRHGTFGGIGLDANWNDWRFITEYTRRGTDGLIANTTGWYATVAYRIGSLTPHFTVSELKTTEDYSGERLAAATMPPMLAMGTLQFARQNKVNQSSTTLGVRWDMAPRIALKAEWQRINPDNDSSPLFAVTDFRYGGDPVNVYSVALDFVF
jgi:hypothetical protein